MYDIDFIKWMCENAEGFNYGEMTQEIILPNGDFIKLSDDKWKILYYPLLLHRAIEGISKECRWNIQSQLPYYYNVMIHIGEFEEPVEIIPIEGGDFDKAKELALKYIYEQEK